MLVLTANVGQLVARPEYDVGNSYMTKCMRRVAVLIIFSSLLGAPAGAHETLKLVANFWGPYTENGLPGQGLASSIVIRLLARAGYDATIEILPWQRALSLVYTGRADGVVAIWSTPERREKILFSEPYMVNRMSLLHRKGMLANVKTIADLRGLAIGVGLGYDYSQEFMQASHFRKDPAVNTLMSLKKLLAGRVDAILEDEAIVAYYLAQDDTALPGAENLEFSPAPLMELPLHFGISRQRPDADAIMARFNAELRRWRGRNFK